MLQVLLTRELVRRAINLNETDQEVMAILITKKDIDFNEYNCARVDDDRFDRVAWYMRDDEDFIKHITYIIKSALDMAIVNTQEG